MSLCNGYQEKIVFLYMHVDSYKNYVKAKQKK